MNVSVVIPVYNAASYIEKAVMSAIEQPQTSEVVLVEDGSKDNSLQVCQGLAAKYANVRLFTHPNNENKGAGASRNLGISKATCDYISFLDADDFFLPNRFEAEEKIFTADENADGVYGALGFHFYSDAAQENYQKAGFASLKLTTVSEAVPPENLKWVLLDIIKGKGGFSIVTLTVKKKLILRTAYFSGLALGEDTAFLIKLAFNGKLVSGIIDRPIGLRGAHEDNRVTKNLRNPLARYKMYDELYRWAQESHQPKSVVSLLLARRISKKIEASGQTERYFIWLKGLFTCRFFRQYEYFFNYAVTLVFKSKSVQLFIIKNKERIQKKIFKKESSTVAMNAELGIH